MQILGRDVPPEIEALHDDVVAQRPEANLKFITAAIAAGERGLHRGDLEGNSEVLLREGFDDYELAHQLLHTRLYRQGYPVTSTLPAYEVSHLPLCRIVACAVSHPAMHEEARRRGLPEAAWKDRVIARALASAQNEPISALDRLDDALAIADALDAYPAVEARLEPRGGDETWRLVGRLRAVMDQSRRPAAMRWRRSMVQLLEEADRALAGELEPPPSQAVAVTLVISEMQLARPAERLVEVTSTGHSAFAFVHKQDGGVFHLPFAGPGVARRELAEIRQARKTLRAEAFLDAYWVPYTVDLNVAPARR